MRLALLPLVFLTSSIAFAAAAPAPAGPQPKVPDAIPDRFVPAPFETQSVTGLLGERMHINLEKRLLAIEEDALLAGFRHRPGVQDWIGEHIGKYLDAAANTWRFTHDPRLKVQMDRMALALIACQKDDGYLGTYVDAQRWTSWDVWVHKYDLIGLLAWYRVSGDERALTASRRIGDLLITTFQGGGHDIIKSSEHVGMAATSVLEPMCQLYRYTGDPRYLAFARFIVDQAWEQPNGPKIISSLLSTGSVFHTANAKAYEMMSDLVGLCELYRLTGDERYFKAALAAQRDVVAHHRYLTGTASAHEHFRDDFDLPAEQKDEVGEGCVTVTWLQLNMQLLRLTGEAQYAQQIERTVFNQLLAAQDPLTGNICYFTPMDGRKKPSTDINCCRSSEPRGISLIPRLLWGALDLIPPGVIVDPVDPRRAIPAAVAIEIIAPGEALIAGVHVKSETNYPFDGHAVFTLTPDQPHRFTFALRVPEWAAAFRATGPDGKQVTGRPGEYLRLNRKWKRGDRVEVDVDLAVRFTPGGKSYPNYVAVERGPLVLALDKGASPNIPDLNQAALKTLPEQLTAEKSGLYDLPGVVTENGHARDVTLHLVPFAAAREYRIWLPQPAAAPAPGR
jgi:hypothetical protein